jgi:hypothetical protein
VKIYRFILISLVVGIMVMLASCMMNGVKPKPSLTRGEEMIHLGEQWVKGDEMVRQGEKMVRDGQAQMEDGKRLIEQGKQLIKETEAKEKSLKPQ